VASVEISKASFKETVNRPGIVFLDWWAAWCGPCRAFAPVYEKASEQHPDIVFGKVDTEAEPELSGAFGIQSIPTLMVFRDGILLFEQAGALPAAALEELVRQVRALDMEAVRKEVAARQAAGEPPAGA
jgi:thioredoxin 1